MERKIVDSLIACKKTIQTPPKTAMTQDQRNAFTLRNDFTCISEDGTVFDVFMRMNTNLPYLFSIGLRFHAENGIFTLCRYNGKHPHRNKIADRKQLFDYHIHRLYDEQLANGTDDNLDADATNRYTSFRDALRVFLQDCHIQDWQTYFHDL